MYSGGSIFVGPSPVRRSLRVAHMTPSKINLPYDDVSEADSEATVKPLKLLGQRGRSRSRSRSPAKTRTPGRKSGPGSAKKNNPFMNPSVIRGQPPLRLDTPGPEVTSLLDSRVKHARNLDNYDEATPFKAGFSDWPSESLVTPLVTVQNNRRISPPKLDDDGTIKGPKIRTDPMKMGKPNGSIFLGRPAAQKKTTSLSKLIGNIDIRQLISLSVLVLGFTITLFYRGEIISYAQDSLSALQSMTSKSAAGPLEQTWRRDLENVFGDLQVLKRDLSRMPQIDLSGILDRLDQVEGREASNDSLLQNIRQRLIEVQKSVASLNEEGQMSEQRVIEVTKKLSSMDQKIGLLEDATDKIDRTVVDHTQSLLLIAEKLKATSSTEEIIKTMMEKVEAMLPEKLLVRLSSKGEVILDPKLFSYLQSVFSSTDGVGGTFDLGPLEKHVQSKIESLEQRLLEKPQVSALVKEQLEKSLAGLHKEIQGDLTKLKSYVDSSKKDGPSVDVDKIAEDLFKRVATQLEIAEVPNVAREMSPNFCSEAAGARPIIALSSKNYHNGDSGNSWKHWVTWATSSAKPHHVALSPDNSFGNCWAFPGSSGQFTVQLAVPVVPTTFTVCHLGKEFRADRSSAPSSFEIHVIPNISVPEETTRLGTYQYDLKGSSCQQFNPQVHLKNPSRHFQIRVTSNHGKRDFTCLYQFGVYSDTHLSHDLHHLLISEVYEGHTLQTEAEMNHVVACLLISAIAAMGLKSFTPTIQIIPDDILSYIFINLMSPLNQFYFYKTCKHYHELFKGHLAPEAFEYIDNRPVLRVLDLYTIWKSLNSDPASSTEALHLLCWHKDIRWYYDLIFEWQIAHPVIRVRYSKKDNQSSCSKVIRMLKHGVDPEVITILVSLYPGKMLKIFYYDSSSFYLIHFYSHIPRCVPLFDRVFRDKKIPLMRVFDRKWENQSRWYHKLTAQQMDVALKFAYRIPHWTHGCGKAFRSVLRSRSNFENFLALFHPRSLKPGFSKLIRMLAYSVPLSTIQQAIRVVKIHNSIFLYDQEIPILLKGCSTDEPFLLNTLHQLEKKTLMPFWTVEHDQLAAELGYSDETRAKIMSILRYKNTH